MLHFTNLTIDGEKVMNSSMKKAIGKLSIWGAIMMFLLWLGKQILAYLLAIIMPWLNWLMGWLMLVGGVLVVCAVIFALSAGYLAYRSWQRGRDEKKNGSDKKSDAKA
jgi:hypothetical protein